MVAQSFAPSSEEIDYRILRQSLHLSDSDAFAPGSAIDRLGPPHRARIGRIFPNFIEAFNPVIRHVVLRTRAYLENEIDPQTGETYLKPVRVNLHGKG